MDDQRSPKSKRQPRAPYHKKRERSTSKGEHERLQAIIGGLRVDIPFVDAIQASQALRKYIKSLVARNQSAQRNVANIREHINSVMTTSLTTKRPDPGSFVLHCSIAGMVFPNSLCDLGSGVNIKPLSVAMKLGMTDFKPSKISLVLVDRSVRYPEGKLEDVKVEIKGFSIPRDFVILKHEEEPRDPLILGRPFLATAVASIDCESGPSNGDKRQPKRSSNT